MKILCIFAKPPIVGKTKSRLAASIGEEPVVELSKIMLNILIKEGKSSIAEKIIIYIPQEFSLSDFKGIDLEGLEGKKQIGVNLGEKMSNMFQECCENNNQVILIGSDCVSITKNILNEGFEKLKSCPIVIQPADDGGYVLIGQSKFIPHVFSGPKWGSATVFNTTIEILRSNSTPFYQLPSAFDIDIKEDLPKLHLINHKELEAWLKKYSY